MISKLQILSVGPLHVGCACRTVAAGYFAWHSHHVPAKEFTALLCLMNYFLVVHLPVMQQILTNVDACPSRRVVVPSGRAPLPRADSILTTMSLTWCAVRHTQSPCVAVWLAGQVLSGQGRAVLIRAADRVAGFPPRWPWTSGNYDADVRMNKI